MRKLTQEEFISRVSKINDTVEILSQYCGYDGHVDCRCKICGKTFSTSAACLLQGCGCKECGHLKTGMKRRISPKDYVDRLSNSNPSIIILDEYETAHKHKRFKCLICGNIWKADPTKILNKLVGCPSCGNRKRGESNALSHEEFLKRAEKNSPNIKILGRYVNNNEPIKMKCLKHNIEFYGYPRCIMYKGGNVCLKCNNSYGEKVLSNILDDFDIDYTVQYKLDGCVYESELKFDAYDLTNNIAYEYQGEQHYKPVDFAGKGDEWAKSNLKLTQARDNAKRKYCEEHKIPLIEIPYWEKDNMRDFLIDKWKELELDIA